MSILAAAIGVRQPKIDDALAGFAKSARPWSFILFREACVSREQVKRLCADLREAAGHDSIIYIDQEGGRVARLKAPAWPTWPACARYGELYAKDAERGVEAAKLGHRLIAYELKQMGVDADYAPVLDAPVDGADQIIGDRAFSYDPSAIAVLGRAALDGLRDGGVLGCVKHIPGHGRADVDSHFSLPKVSAGRDQLVVDWAPFCALNDAEAAMTAHIVYASIDPDRPATHSPIVIEKIIRGEIGFDGLLCSDDLDMKALEGALQTKAEKAFAAGCDLVLQCSGAISDMEDVAKGCPTLSGKARERAERAAAVAKSTPKAFDAAHGWHRYWALMGPYWTPK